MSELSPFPQEPIHHEGICNGFSTTCTRTPDQKLSLHLRILEDVEESGCYMVCGAWECVDCYPLSDEEALRTQDLNASRWPVVPPREMDELGLDVADLA